MKDIKEYILESEVNTKYNITADKDHFIVNAQKKIDIDNKYKYVVILGDSYTGHLKDEYLYEDQQALYLHSDRDWDLPELIFGESDKNMKKLIKDIKNDDYFISYEGKINRSIYTLETLFDKSKKIYKELFNFSYKDNDICYFRYIENSKWLNKNIE
jgi:hypothetical protein